jgi:ferredoxin-NADP reductase
MEYEVKILEKEMVTHDTIRFKVEKPEGYNYEMGQACRLSINLADWKDEKRFFSFTSINGDDFLEFHAKIYHDRNSVSKKMVDLNIGDGFLISDPVKSSMYKGKGVFIAAGVGITPFMSIMRQLRKDGKLDGHTFVYSNKEEKDIIFRNELEEMKKDGLKLMHTLTREEKDGFLHGRVDKEFLTREIGDFNQEFHVCGTNEFMIAVRRTLRELKEGN